MRRGESSSKNPLWESDKTYSRRMSKSRGKSALVEGTTCESTQKLERQTSLDASVKQEEWVIHEAPWTLA